MVASTLNPNEQIIKLAKATDHLPFCRKTIKKLVETGDLEAWWIGDTQVTTKEACSRAAIPVEPKPASTAKPRRTSKAQADIEHFLALK